MTSRRESHIAALTCVHVLERGAPILLVSHDDDGDWQFLCKAEHSEAGEDRVVGLPHQRVADTGWAVQIVPAGAGKI